MLLYMLVAAILDPVKILGSFVLINYILKGSHWLTSIAISALITGVFSEILLNMSQATRAFGQGLFIQILAGLIVASVAYGIVQLWQKE